jgi:hypothetical protein
MGKIKEFLRNGIESKAVQVGGVSLAVALAVVSGGAHENAERVFTRLTGGDTDKVFDQDHYDQQVAEYLLHIFRNEDGGRINGNQFANLLAEVSPQRRNQLFENMLKLGVPSENYKQILVPLIQYLLKDTSVTPEFRSYYQRFNIAFNFQTPDQVVHSFELNFNPTTNAFEGGIDSQKAEKAQMLEALELISEEQPVSNLYWQLDINSTYSEGVVEADATFRPDSSDAAYQVPRGTTVYLSMYEQVDFNETWGASGCRYRYYTFHNGENAREVTEIAAAELLECYDYQAGTTEAASRYANIISTESPTVRVQYHYDETEYEELVQQIEGMSTRVALGQ